MVIFRSLLKDLTPNSETLMKRLAALSLLALFPIFSSAQADDCQFIRDALVKAKAGDTVKVPAGLYTCATAIVMDRDGITLEGEQGARLRLADHANAPLVVMGSILTPPPIVKNITVRNLDLDGNKDNQDGECWGGGCDSGGTAHIRNNSLTVRGVHGALIENVVTHHARSGGLVTEKDVARLTVRQLDSHSNFFDGFAGYVTVDSIFSGLRLHHNHYAGISIDWHFDRNRFEDTEIYDNGDVGIFARFSDGNEFVRTNIVNSGNHGIFLSSDSRQDTCPENYAFRGLKVSGSKNWGFWFNDPRCTGTKIQNAEFRDNGGGCVFVPRDGKVEMTDVSCR
jgi:hypothetical protein